jgi:hypothetical protein
VSKEYAGNEHLSSVAAFISISEETVELQTLEVEDII